MLRVAIFFLLGFSSSVSFCQNAIVAKAFVKSATVYLRFLPSNGFTLNACTKAGYQIKRIPWNNDKVPDSTKFKFATTLFAKKAVDSESPEWDVLSTKFPETGFLYSCLYKSINNKTAEAEMAFGLAMLSCDFNVDLAKAAGLFLKEENITKAHYAYLIQPADNELRKTIQPAIIVVNTNEDTFLKNIDSLKIKNKRKEVKLVWNEKELKPYYSGYYIERSEDGKLYVQLNKKPHVQITTQHEKNKINISYNDTITEYGKTYYYRVRGINCFGLQGNYSNSVKCKLIKPLEDFPQADSTHLLHDSVLQVHWHMPVKINLAELKGYNIYRSADIEGVYVKINRKWLDNTTKMYVDYFPKQSNYYKIVAYNNYGDSAESHPMMGLIPDKTPPKSPVGLNGKVDTLGRVMLTWKANKELDLMGYRIFRNNAMNEELVEITKLIFNDTIFNDTVSIQTLTEEIYYSITAVDQVYNNSPFSKSIKLKRPDKIKPVEAQFKTITHTDSSIVAKWIPSTSKDVVRYELYRKTEKTNFVKIKEWSPDKMMDSIEDSALEYATYYTYQLKVLDDDGNFSISTSGQHYYDARVRKAIKKIKCKIDNEKKVVILNWEYPENELYNFVIYKARVGNPLKIIKTLQPTIFSFEDKDVSIGNKYVYKLKANFNSGAESFISNEIVIEY